MSRLSVYFYMGKTKRSEVRGKVIDYLQKFYLDFILYKDLPVVNKLYCKGWAMDMYEQLSDKQRVAIYLKLIKKTDK